MYTDDAFKLGHIPVEGMQHREQDGGPGSRVSCGDALGDIMVLVLGALGER